MSVALRSAGPAIFASGLTVIAALLCLSLAEVNGTARPRADRRDGHRGRDGRDADPAAGAARDLRAAGVLVGRSLDTIPHFGQQGADETHGAWRRVGERVARAPARASGRRGTPLLVSVARTARTSTRA